jgi:iron-sulfur cluster assembly protein
LLKLTDNAAQAINGLVSDLPGAGLRISSDQMTEERGTLRVGVAPNPAPNDVVVEEQGTQVFVEEALAPVLEDKTLDATFSDERGVSFKLFKG